jgi:protocatechuate 3,4-dioxygenase beta subunit
MAGKDCQARVHGFTCPEQRIHPRLYLQREECMQLTSRLMICLLSLTVCAQAPQVAEKNAPSNITIAAKEEPGERLVVAGRVFDADGKTPLTRASVYVYHTDAKGLYTPDTNDNRNPRLRGYLRTDADGRYEYSTIKPAPYPNNRAPAHIHYVVNAPGYQELIFEIIFEGDLHIDERLRAEAAREGSAFSLRKLTRDQQGVWHCTQDIKMSKP